MKYNIQQDFSKRKIILVRFLVLKTTSTWKVRHDTLLDFFKKQIPFVNFMIPCLNRNACFKQAIRKYVSSPSGRNRSIIFSILIDVIHNHKGIQKFMKPFYTVRIFRNVTHGYQ